MTINSEYLYLQELIYSDKNYDKAKEIILNSDKSNEEEYQELLGLIYFYQFDFVKSAEIFKNISDKYKYAYSLLLLNQHEECREVLNAAPMSPAVNWTLFFCEMFSPHVTHTPTYLQIRSFLERDLNLYLKIDLDEYVQKIIDISDFLFEVNPETNKLIAKTFLYNNYPEYAKEYLTRAFEYTDKDAELYYLSGIYYLGQNEISDAKSSFKKTLILNENYIPAKIKLKELA